MKPSILASTLALATGALAVAAPRPAATQPDPRPRWSAPTRGAVGVTTRVRKNIAVSVSFNARYDNFPTPLPAFALPDAPGFTPLADKLDAITKASLILSFL